MAKAQSNSAPPEFPFEDRSFASLIELRRQIDEEIGRRKAVEIENLRAKVAESANALGVSVHELFGLPPAKRETKHARGRQPAQYRGPNGEEWSGRGPSPQWLKQLLARGRTKENFRIGGA